MKTFHFKSGARFASVSILQASIIAIVFVWILQIAADAEATDSDAKNSKRRRIRITADRLVAKLGAAEIEFIGNVKATQAGALITADFLKVIYVPEALSYQGGTENIASIRKIIANGRVKIATDDIRAEADTAEYTVKSAVLVLKGAPSRVTRGAHSITGMKFTLHRTDGHITVESSGENRVTATFHP